MPYAWILSILRFLGGGVCHQLPSRSLQLADTPLPLCARCTGTYLGATIGLSLVVLRGRARASLVPRWPGLALFGAFFLAWAIDGANSYLTLFVGAPHLYEPSSTLRLVTGSLQGLALSLTIWPVAAFTLWRQPQPIRVVELGELAAGVLATLLVVALVSLGAPAVLFAAGLLSDLGLVALFALLNTLLLTVVLHREGTFDTLLQAWWLLAGALLLANAELLLLSFLRHRFLGF